MIIAADDEVIIGSNNQTQKTKFRIAHSAKAFKILSSNLYKNKIRAVVRELSTNCLDAHKLNGFAGAFEIKAPTRLDPRFVIRDFGPGMSDVDITDMYSTYFASTKSNSNDFIGALGLGSKSPFSYTETFTVVSYFEGEVRGYTAMMDAGEPVLVPVFTEKMSDEDKTGIEITVPVKVDDIRSWYDEIAYVVRPFGQDKVTLKSLDQEVNWFPQEETEWFTGNFGYEGGGLFAVYGNIVYPLNEVKGLEGLWLKAKFNRTYIHFPLGELDITPSREELSFDEETVANIKRRVNGLNNARFKADMTALEKIENKRQLLREINKLSHPERQVLINSGNALIQGKSIQDWTGKFNPDNVGEIGCAYRVYQDAKRMKITRSYGRASKISPTELWGIAKDKVFVLINDKPSKLLPTIRAWAANPGADKKTPSIGAYITVFNEEPEEVAAFARLERLMEGDTLIIQRVSELEQVRKKDPNYGVVNRDTIRPKSDNVIKWYLDPKCGYWQSDKFCMSAVEIDELEGLAIASNRDDIHTYPENTYWYGKDIGSVKTMAETMGINSFYQIRPAAINRAVKNDGLESLFDVITDKLIELIDEVDMDNYIPTNVRNQRIFGHTQTYKKLAFMTRYFVLGKECKHAQLLLKLMTHYFAHNWFAEDFPRYNDHKLVVQTYDKLVKRVNEMTSGKSEEFVKTHPVIAQVMSGWNLSEDIVNDIVKLLEGE